MSAGTYVTLNGATAGTSAAANAGVQLGANISSSTLFSGQGVNITAATGLYGDGIMMKTSAGAAASVTITSGTTALVGGDVNFLANSVNSGWNALYGYLAGNISITTYGANINLGTSLAPLAGGNAIFANSGNLFGTLRATTVGAGSGNINIYGLSTLSAGNSAFGGTITADSAVTIYAKNSASTSTVSALATNAVITSNNSSATITGINQGTGASGAAVTATGLITGNSIAVTGTSVAAATVVSLGAMTINACSAGVACNSNNISVTGNDTAAGGNTGITQTGAITDNANGGSIYFISNNQISQAGNISIAQNTSGIDSVISYNTTNGNKLSTINAGAVTFLGTSTSHINYNNIASGAPIIVNSALNVPGSITFDNTYLAGVQGGINASNAWQYGTTAANGIAITCATTVACGSLTANYGIYLRGVVGASSSSANQTFDAVSINAVAPLAITSSGTFAAGTDAINIVGITPQFVVTTNATPTSAVKGNAIGISGAVTITNNSTGGNTNIVAYQGRYSDAVTITNASTAGALELSAIGTTADIVTIAGTTFTQNSNAGVFIATSNNGNVTPPKIINNGTGPVVIEAGAYLPVGTVSSVCSAADCGQITAISGNSITSANGNVYLYAGSPGVTAGTTSTQASLGLLSPSLGDFTFSNTLFSQAYAAGNVAATSLPIFTLGGINTANVAGGTGGTSWNTGAITSTNTGPVIQFRISPSYTATLSGNVTKVYGTNDPLATAGNLTTPGSLDYQLQALYTKTTNNSGWVSNGTVVGTGSSAITCASTDGCALIPVNSVNFVVPLDAFVNSLQALPPTPRTSYGTLAGEQVNTNSTSYTYNITSTHGISVSSGVTINSQSFGNVGLVITPAPLTITASAESKNYGSTLTPAGTEFTTTGLKSTTTVDGVTLTDTISTVSLASSGFASSANAGTYAITPSAPTFTSGVASNYAISYAPGTLTVLGISVYVTAVNDGKVYGSSTTTGGITYNSSGVVTNPASSAYSVTGLLAGNSISGLTLTSTGGIASAGVGTYSIVPSLATISGAGAGNYTVYYTNGTMTITPKPITITANAVTTTYGTSSALSQSAYTVTGGLATGDAITAAAINYGTGTSVPGTVNAGTYAGAIVPSGATGTGGFNSTNYAISYTAGNLTVNPLNLTITASAQGTSYGTAYSLGSSAYTQSVANLPNSDAISGVVLQSGGVNLVPGATNAGSYTITPSAATFSSGLASNYNISYVTGALTIAKADLTITPNAVSTTYNGTTLNNTTYSDAIANYSIAGYKNTDTSVNTPIALTGAMTFTSTGQSTVKNAATYTYGVGTLVGTSTNTNYNIVWANAPNNAYVINKATATITATKPYDGTVNFATSTLTVIGVGSETLTVSAGTGAANSANVVGVSSLTTSGYTLANGTGLASNYILPTSTSSVTITPLTLTAAISGSAQTKVYDTTSTANLTAGSCSVSPCTAGNGVTLSGNAATSGSYTISGFVAGEGAYITASTGNFINATTGLATPNVTLNNQAIADGSQANAVKVSIAPTNILALSNTILSNYVLPSAAQSPSTATITAAPLGVVANNYSMFTGGTTPTAVSGVSVTSASPSAPATPGTTSLSAQVSGLLGSDSVAVSLPLPGGFTASASGTYTLTPSIAASVTAGNYSITPTTAVLSVVGNQDLVISAGNASHVYGTVTAANLATSATPVVQYCAAVTGSCAGAVISLTVAPTATPNVWSATSNTGGIYNFTVTVANPTYSTGGYVNVGSYAATPSNNQVIHTDTVTILQTYYVAGTVAVTPLAVTPINNQVPSKVYDATTVLAMTPLSTANMSLAGDTLSITGTAAYNSKDVGTNVGYTISNLALGGADAANYVLSTNTLTGTNGTITPAPLTVGGLSANSKVYDTTNVASISSAGQMLVGVLGTDAVSISSTGNYVGSFSQVNAANNLTVTAATSTLGGLTVMSGVTLAGIDSGNYYVAGPSTALSANITKAPLTISGLAAQNKVYNGSTNYADIITGNATLSGVLTADQNSPTVLALSGSVTSGTFASANVANNIGVSADLSGLQLSGTSAQNYQIVGINTPLVANITAAPVYITGGLAAQNKIYDTTTAATVNVVGAQTLSGVITGDAVAVSNPTSGNYANSFTFTSPNVANSISVNPVLSSNAIAGISLTGAQATNYYIAGIAMPQSLAANITPAPVYITGGLTAQNKVYDTTTAATVAAGVITLSGNLGGDNLTVASPGTSGFTSSFNFSQSNIGSALTVSPIIGGSGAISGISLASTTNSAGNYYIAGIAAPQSLAANITPAPLTISGGLTAQNKVYDTNTAANIAATGVQTLSGLVGSDINTNNVTIVTSGPYAGTFSAANVGNSLTVTPTTASTTINGSSYNTMNGVTLSGPSAGNYYVSGVSQTLAANITPAPVYITGGLTAQNKVYDTTTAAVVNVTGTQTLSGVFTADANKVAVTSSGSYNGNFSSANVGNSLTVTPVTTSVGGNFAMTGPVLGAGSNGNASANYYVAGVAPNLLAANITPAPVYINGGLTAQSKVYDATSAAVINSTGNQTLSGVFTSDTGNVLVSSTGPYAGANFTANNVNTSNVGTAITVTPATSTVAIGGQNYTVMSGVSISGSASGNYYVAGVTPNSLTADITKANLTITATNQASFYTLTPNDASSNSVITYMVSGLLGNDTVTSATTTATVAPTNITPSSPLLTTSSSAGSYAANVSNAQGTGLTNYSITYVPGTYTIVPAGQLLISTTGVTYTYGSPQSVPTPIATYMDANHQVISTLVTYTPNNPTAPYNYHDNAGAIVSFNIVPVNASNSGAGVINVGVYGLATSNLSITNASNLTSAQAVVTGNLQVTPLAVAISATPTTVMYNGATQSQSAYTTSPAILTGDAVTVSGGVATGKNVGTYSSNLSTSGSDAGNYKFTYNNANLVITPYIIDPSSSSGPNIAATANNKVYDTTTTATGALTMTGLLAGDVVNANYANANFADANVGAAKTVTFSGITLSGPAAANYVMSTAAGPVTATANITPAPVYITGGLTAQNKVYDTTTAATVTAGNAVTLSGVLGSDTVTAPSAGNYANSFAFSQANVANNLTVTPVLNNNGAVAGSLALGGAQAANYYIAGVNIIPSLVANITPKPVYITAGLTAQDKVYDATTVAYITAGAQTLSGVYSADQSNVSVASTGTYTGTFASPNVNQGAAWAVAPNTSSTTINGVGYTTVTGTSLSGSAAGNYYIAGVSQSLSANITPAPLTITANNAASFVTQNLSALGYTVNGLLGSDAVAIATTAAVVSSTNSTALSSSTGAGTYATTVTGATGTGLANYTITYNPGVYTIVPAGQLLITTTGTTTPYGTAGTIPVPTVSYQTTGNVVISNLVAGTPVTTDGITTYTYSDGAGTNISFSLAPTGTTLSGSGNINVGTYGLVANSFTKTGGNLTSSSAVVTGDYNVVPLAVTITATPRSVVYSGAAQNQLAYTTSTPILSGDYVAVTGLASGTNVGTYNSSLVVGGTTSGNNNTNDYTFTLVDKPLTITPYIINFGSGSGPSISATAQSKQYDTTTTTSGSLTMGNLLSANDQVTASYGAANFANANVGTAKTVTFTGIVLAGPGSGNYQIGVAPVTATANITPAPVYITGGLTAQNKVYDTTTAAVVNVTGTQTLSGVFTADTGSVSANSTGPYAGTFADANVANNIAVTPSTTIANGITSMAGATLTGAASGNYYIAGVSSNLLKANITPAPLTISGGLTAQNKVYDTNTAANIAATGVQTLSGLVGSDINTNNVTIVTSGPYAGTFSAANVGNSLTVTPTTASTTINGSSYNTMNGVTLSGPSAGNYYVSGVSQTLAANITPAPVYITGGLTAQNKVYDTTTAAVVNVTGTQTLSGVFTADTGSVSANSTGPYAGTFADANVANNIAVTPSTTIANGITSMAGATLTGAASGNYYIAGVSSNLLKANITPAPLTISGGLTAQSKTYDATNTAVISVGGTQTLNGLLGSDIGQTNVIISSSGPYAGTFSAANVGNSLTVTPTTASTTINGSSYNTMNGVTLSGPSAGNYYVSGVSQTLAANITPAPVYITGGLTAQNKVYDTTTAATVTAGTITLSGVLGSDAVTAPTAGNYANSFAFASANAGSGITVSPVLSSTNGPVAGMSLAGANGANYYIAGIAAPQTLTANITPAPVTISGLVANNKVYTSTTADVISGTPIVTGLLGSDTSTATGTAVGTFASPNVANGISVSADLSGMTLSNGNYVITGLTAPLAANITPAPLTISSGLVAQNKVYDTTAAGVIAAIGTQTLAGVLGSDAANLAVSSSGPYTGSFSQASVGNGLTVSQATVTTVINGQSYTTMAGVNLSGSAAGNYYVTGPTTALTANITKAPVTISGLLAQNKVFDGTTAAIITGNPVIAGLLGSDVSTLSGSVLAGIFASANPADRILVKAMLDALILGNPNYYIADVTFPLFADITSPPQTTNNMAIVQQQATPEFVPERPTYLINKGDLIYVRDKDDLPKYLQAIEVPPSGAFKFPVPDSIIQDLINLSGENAALAKQAGSYKLLLLPKGSKLVVTLPDGAALPTGIKYDAGTNTFVVPKLGNVTLPLSVKVTLMRGTQTLSQKIMAVTK